jgi:hypothetical protein
MKFEGKFFRRIFRNVLQQHHLDVEIRCLSRLNDKDNSYPPIQFWCRSLRALQERWPAIRKLSRRGWDIHFTIVGRRRKTHGRKEHPLPDKPVWTCFWADLDVGEHKPYRTFKSAYRAIKSLTLQPNIVVESGSGLHCYYLLKEPTVISLKRSDKLLKAITTKLRGDTLHVWEEDGRDFAISQT